MHKAGFSESWHSFQQLSDNKAISCDSSSRERTVDNAAVLEHMINVELPLLSKQFVTKSTMGK